MSRESVRAFLDAHAPDIAIITLAAETSSVAMAAAGHGVPTGQIAKTLSLRANGQTFLLVAGGDARLDNKKLKARFGGKASMLSQEEALELTGHPIGGVCPFGLATPLKVFCDVSLKAFAEVVPAAGDRFSALRIAPERMAAITSAEWVDVCQDVSAPGP
jgi:prolyl-tRNA editing enzyme YbaK/EbsC (Cys-tRNA(Pro) deacylase)